MSLRKADGVNGGGEFSSIAGVGTDGGRPKLWHCQPSLRVYSAEGNSIHLLPMDASLDSHLYIKQWQARYVVYTEFRVTASVLLMACLICIPRNADSTTDTNTRCAAQSKPKLSSVASDTFHCLHRPHKLSTVSLIALLCRSVNPRRIKRALSFGHPNDNGPFVSKCR